MAQLDHGSLIREISRLLPEPVRADLDMIELNAEFVLIGGEPGEVIVQIGESDVTISEYTVSWKGSHSPVIEAVKVGALSWEHIPETNLIKKLRELITKTIELRRAKYRTCENCGETNPPEWMHSETVCQSCAERDLGVFH